MFPYHLRVLGLWLFALTVSIPAGLIVLVLIFFSPALVEGSLDGAAAWGWYTFLPAFGLGVGAGVFALVTTLRRLSALGLFAIPPYRLDRSQAKLARILYCVPIAAASILLLTPLGEPMFRFLGMGTHSRVRYETTDRSRIQHVDKIEVGEVLEDIARMHGLSCGRCDPSNGRGRFDGKGVALTYDFTTDRKLEMEIATTSGGLYPGSVDRADRVEHDVRKQIGPYFQWKVPAP
jgi:hypothetical protein